MYEADMNLYQVKMALKFLEDYRTSNDELKPKIASKFKKHSANIDTYFKDANLNTDMENLVTQLQAIVLLVYSSWEFERDLERMRKKTIPKGVPNSSSSL